VRVGSSARKPPLARWTAKNASGCAKVTDKHPVYAKYQSCTERQIPLVLIKPSSSGTQTDAVPR
jgi:hypothetical protein